MEDLALKEIETGRIKSFRQFTQAEKGEIQRLVKSGLSLRKVSRRLGVPYWMVHRIVALYSKRQSRINLNALTEPERGYIVGAFVGDGSKISETTSGHYGVKFSLDSKSDEEIAHYLRNLFVKTGKRVTLYTEKTCFVLKIYSQKLLEFLLSFVNYTEVEGKKRKLLTGFENWALDFQLGFISGLIDTDGYVHHGRQGIQHFGLSITTMNSALSEQLVSMLEGLGSEPKVRRIKPSRTSFNTKPTYIVYLSKLEFSKICRELISIKHMGFHENKILLEQDASNQ